MTGSEAKILDRMCQKYGGRPSDWVFDTRPDAYHRYAFDAAIFARAAREEALAYRKVKRRVKSGDHKQDEKAPQHNRVTLDGSGSMAGSFGGRVGDGISYSMMRKLRDAGQLGNQLTQKLERRERQQARKQKVTLNGT